MRNEGHCPACGKTVSVNFTNMHSNSLVVYCGNGQCPDDRMNVGATARTVEAALDVLHEIHCGPPVLQTPDTIRRED